MKFAYYVYSATCHTVNASDLYMAYMPIHSPYMPLKCMTDM